MKQLDPKNFYSYSEAERDDIISEYIYGRLTPIQAADFRAILEADEALMKEVKSQERLIKFNKRNHDRSLVKKGRKKYDKKTLTQATIVGLGIAAMILIVVSIHLYEPAEVLYAQEATKLPNSCQALKEYPCQPKRAAFAYQDSTAIYYRICDNNNCIAFFERLTAPSVVASFYAANAYLKAGNFKKAHVNFLRVAKSETLPGLHEEFLEDARANAAALSLRFKDPVLAEQIMNLDPDSDTYKPLKKCLFVGYLEARMIHKADSLLHTEDMNYSDTLRYQIKMLRVF